MNENMGNKILQEIRKTNLELKKTNEDIQEIKKIMNEKFEQVNEKFKQVDESLKELKTTVDSINRNVIKLEEKYEAKTETLYEVFPEFVEKMNSNESRSIKNKFDIETIKLALRINEPKAVNE